MEDVLIKGEKFDLKYVQEKLFCLMQEEWADKIPAMPKLRYYIKFKSDIITASYLKANITRTQRSLLAQLRLGILPLAIETDRYYRIPLDKRFCKLCDENVIEDEIHFICICKFFAEEREALLIKLHCAGQNLEITPSMNNLYVLCHMMIKLLVNMLKKLGLNVKACSFYK